VKILFINPNTYRTPPVPPIALEYLSAALDGLPHESRILDLCFSDDPAADTARALDDFRPDLAAVTIRNIDTVIRANNVFFLDGIRELVNGIRERGVPVVAGGAGFSFNPAGVLSYIGADWGVAGPGERAIAVIADRLATDPPERGTVLDGWSLGFDPGMRVVRGRGIDYGRYIASGGLAGFQTQKGCLERCPYCAEGTGRHTVRTSGAVVGEIASLVETGVTDFHLCDTEFNQDLGFCKTFLRRLIDARLPIRWAVYMKTSPWDNELFGLLAASGAHLVTVSIPTGTNSLENAGGLIASAKAHGLNVAVDLLVGFPGDTGKSVAGTVAVLRAMKSDTVGVNATIRLYEGLPITRRILSSDQEREFIDGDIDGNPGLIHPVFYNHLTVDALRDIIGGDPLFKIEGFERTSNYERIPHASGSAGS